MVRFEAELWNEVFINRHVIFFSILFVEIITEPKNPKEEYTQILCIFLIRLEHFHFDEIVIFSFLGTYNLCGLKTLESVQLFLNNEYYCKSEETGFLCLFSIYFIKFHTTSFQSTTFFPFWFLSLSLHSYEE